MKMSHRLKTATAATLGAAALGIFLAGPVQAEQCPLVPPDSTNAESYHMSDFFRRGKFDDLEKEIAKVHRKNMSISGGDLLTERYIIDMLAGQNENLVNMWLDAYPKSFFSQLTAGFFYTDRADVIRAGRPLSQVSKNDLKRVSQLNGTAVEHLQKAMELDPHSALPQTILMGVARIEGKALGKTPEQWLDAANQADPKNLSARMNATNYLSPRWGGSFELLDQMAGQAEKSLSAQSEHYLRFNIMMARASHEEVITKNKAKAYELYKQAKGMCENSEKAQDATVRTYQKH